MKRRVSVYGMTENGEMRLLRRCIPEDEAKKLADDYWRRTGCTAVLVIFLQEESKVYQRRHIYGHHAEDTD